MECEPNNNPIIIHNNVSIGHKNEDISDSDNDTFRFIELTVNINKVSSDIIMTYSNELQSRFEYSLDATIHFEDNKSDRIPFTIESNIIVIDPKQVSDYVIYITTLSNSNAKEIKSIIEMDIFLFIFQETLRDSHFKNCILESINQIKITSHIPQIGNRENIEINSTKSEGISTTNINDDAAPKKEEHDNFFKLLFTSASATDWISFIGVIAASIFLCLCCIGCIMILCIYEQRNKTRKEIQKYKQTNIGDSDSDVDEMQGMINNNDNYMNEQSIISHKSHSIKSFLSKQSHKTVSIYKNDAISEKIKMVNRANNLKDKVERHHKDSQSGLHSHKKKHKKHKKDKNKRLLSNSYSQLRMCYGII